MYPWELFGYKTAWIAARDCTPEELGDALELTRVRATSPADAINGPTDRLTLAVLPPVPGVGGMWTLATGNIFFDVDAATLAAVSQRLGTQVQQFGTHRVSDYHLWALADEGRLVRQYRFNGCDGELEAWTGRPTPAEVELGLPDVAGFATEDEAWEAEACDVNEETVLQVAAAWSVDPMELGDTMADRPALVCLEPPDINAVGRGYDPGGPTPSQHSRHPAVDAEDEDDGGSASSGSASSGQSTEELINEVVGKVLGRLFGRR